MGMRLRSIVSYFVALNHGIICSLFGVFGKPGNEIIIVSSGYAAAGVNNGRQRTALPSRVRGKFLCQRGKCLQSGQKEGRPGRAWVSNSEPGGVVLSFRLLLRKSHLPRQRKALAPATTTHIPPRRGGCPHRPLRFTYGQKDCGPDRSQVRFVW